MRDLPKPGQVYRHFKGNIYRVLTLADHSETGEILVIYKRDDPEANAYARPLDMFMSEVDRKKYPNVREKYRFTLIDEESAEDAAGMAASSGDNEGGTIDPLLEAFLDASSVSEKIERFYDMRKSADESLLGYVASSLDMEVTGDKDEMYSEIMRALKAKEKYESNRHHRQ